MGVKGDITLRRAFSRQSRHVRDRRRQRLVGFIPARGGSKGIPGKNLKRVGGYPLIARSIMALHRTELLDAIYVSSDDSEILRVAALYGAKPIVRPTGISGDKASTEEAIIHFLQCVKVHAVVMVQCTSPKLDPEHVRAAVEKFGANNYDSVFSVVSTKAMDMLLWNKDLEPVNYDPLDRSNRKERKETMLIESGNFYIFKASAFLKDRNRICGRFATHELPSNHYLQIDDPKDLVAARKLLD